MMCMRKKHFFVAVLVVSSFCISCSFAAEWESLFDGKSLDGWHVRGGFAKYAVEAA